MAGEYQVTVQELLTMLLTDADRFSKLLLDIADEQVEAGALAETISDTAKPMIKPYIVSALTGLQAKLGELSITAEA